MDISEERAVPDISFIVVNYQSADVLPACFASFSNIFIPGSYEILVANNDVREKEALLLLQQKFSFSIIDIPENRGFSGASNRAAREARGRILVFLNPDTRFLSGDLSVPIASLDLGEAGVTGLQLFSEQSRWEAWSAGREVTLLSLMANHLGLFPRLGQTLREQPVAWVSGAALLVSRELFFQVGGFDEGFFLYYEDVDFCFRARKAGKKVLLSPKVQVLHIGGKSMRSVGRSRQKAAYYESQMRYFRMRRPIYETFLLRFVHTLLRHF